MIKNIQLQVLPNQAANSDLLLKVVSEKVDSKESSIKHIDLSLEFMNLSLNL